MICFDIFYLTNLGKSRYGRRRAVLQTETLMGKRVLNQNSFIKIGQAAKTLGVSVDTLRRWERSGKITAIYTPGGTRLYPLKTFPPPLPTSSSLIQQVQVNSQKAEKIIKNAHRNRA